MQGEMQPLTSGTQPRVSVCREGWEAVRARPPLPRLTPTLVFPVMLKRKLKVRRREEAAQVPELRSSWLQLRREKEEVKWSSHRDGGGGAMTRGETADASAKTREREREGEGALGGQGAPTTHLLGLPGCGHWVPRPHYLCRELQAPPRWMQTTPSY